MSCNRKNAITLAGSREPLNGSMQTRGDTPTFGIKIRGTSLTGATLRFTAKTCVDDPDSIAEIKKTSATSGGIAINTANSTADLLLATMKWSAIDTETIDIVPTPDGKPGKLKLNYDLQMVTSTGDVLTIEGSKEEAHFWLLSDITLTNS